MDRHATNDHNTPRTPSPIRHKAICCILSAALATSMCAVGPLLAFAEDNTSDPNVAQNDESKTQLQDDSTSNEEAATGSSEATEIDSSPNVISGVNVSTGDITDEQIDEALQGIDESAAISTFSAVSTYALSGSSGTVTYGGDTMYETAVSQAKAAYSSCSTAILAGPGEAWVDALSAAGLAGGLDCPILFTYRDSVHPATMQALKDLGVRSVVIVGGPLAVSDSVVRQLSAQGISLKARLGGTDCYDTQMKIYQFGKDNGLWTGGTAFVATGGWFGDALSASPVAFATKSPIFLSRNGGLDSAQRRAIESGLSSGEFDSVVVLGGPLAISQSTGDSLKASAQAAGGSFARLWGDEQYETSVAIANWAVANKGFTWDSAAFTTGYEPYDALAGSVLQGKSRSVLLLVGPSTSATISAAASNKGSIYTVRFFGGTIAIPTSIRNKIVNALSMNESYESTGISLSAMAALEGKSSSLIDPSSVSTDSSAYYQFAVLNQGYSGKITASQIDAYIASKCVYQESNYNTTSSLRGMGSTIIAAAKKYNVNEVYLLSHAIVESAWGCSTLATGKVTGYAGYYNFFGIGAYDYDADNGGAALAKLSGWNTPAKAIEGAAAWISQNYLNNKYSQNTLYKMRWNYIQAAAEQAVWHQYATANTWATGIASVMDNCYRFMGVSRSDTGLQFLVPQYS